MSDLPQISESEFEVMKVCADQHQRNNRKIIADYKLESQNDTDTD